MENRTLEAPPEGTVNVFVKTQGSRKAHVRWEAPFRPNGRLTYSVLFTGIFYVDPGNLFLFSKLQITLENNSLLFRIFPFSHRCWFLYFPENNLYG